MMLSKKHPLVTLGLKTIEKMIRFKYGYFTKWINDPFQIFIPMTRQHSQLEHQCKKTTNSNPMHPEAIPPVPPAR